jgi:site-specific recombinase XerD
MNLIDISNPVITEIAQAMLPLLDNAQMSALQKVLVYTLGDMSTLTDKLSDIGSNEALIKAFNDAKSVEGCSARTLHYYRTELKKITNSIAKPIKHIVTNDLRGYLGALQSERCVSNVTLNNVRRIMSSFFAWLEAEDYILKSPVRRIHAIRSEKRVKETYSDEALALMRDKIDNARDLAIIDLLASSGMRIGELVKLNRDDIDFQNRECVVFGKGDKERRAYFDAQAKLHLQAYLSGRTDDNPALFVGLQRPYLRLGLNGIESRLRNYGRALGIPKMHAHKFRRTLATMAIDKGMPIEQVQQLLGHEKIDTTLHYAMVNQGNVKSSHKKIM